MRTTAFASIVCSHMALVCVPGAGARSTARPEDTLKAHLLEKGDEMMAAWKKHDSAGIASTFAPDFVYVGGDAVFQDASATLKVLANCNVTSYHILESRLKQLSPTAAVLITKQQQEISCFGHPAPPVMNMTDTYVF